ncbi:MAG: hypothetical protein K6E68_00470 [Lachnospiraceae bacterium]|nr:hypothetical protein [Lachnospiraceae bacterium]
MKRKMLITVATIAGICLMAGCGRTVVEEYPYEDELYEEYIDEDEYEYEEDTAGATLKDAVEETTEEVSDNSVAVGTWYTEDYDEDLNWATSYKIELTSDGKAVCTGWRNKDTGTFEMIGADMALITFDDCETDEAGEGYKVVDGFIYTIEMEITGDDAKIKIDAPDVISNLEDGTVHRKSETSMTDDAEDIADGEYITDEQYKGDITADGTVLTIETAINHYDEDTWETVNDYKKRNYVFKTTADCKCVVYGEEKEEYPVAEQVEFINEFLHGNSGLPITLKIKNNEVYEIGFSS